MRMRNNVGTWNTAEMQGWREGEREGGREGGKERGRERGKERQNKHFVRVKV